MTQPAHPHPKRFAVCKGQARLAFQSPAVPRRARYGAAPPASKVAPRSLRDGLRPPLTPEPLRPLPGGKRGQARGSPAGRAALDTLISTTKPTQVEETKPPGG